MWHESQFEAEESAQELVRVSERSVIVAKYDGLFFVSEKGSSKIDPRYVKVSEFNPPSDGGEMSDDEFWGGVSEN